VTPFLLAISILLPVALGLSIVAAVWPGDIPRSRLLLLALSLGVGCCACSALLFAWLIVVGRAGRGVLVIEIALVAILAAVAYRRSVRDSPRTVESSASRLVLCGAAIALLLAAALFILKVSRSPYGDWDAWAGWNLKARMIYLGGDQWRDAFSGGLPNQMQDYPMLLPLSVAQMWLCAGSAAQLGPVILSLAFTASTVLLLGCSVSMLRGRAQGLLAVTALGATPFFVTNGTAQYADVPVAFFFLAALVMLALSGRYQHRGLLVLAGLSAGSAAWTKNEGIAFLICVAIAMVALRRWRNLGWYAVGAAVPVALVLYLKLFLVKQPNLILRGQSWHDFAARLMLPESYPTIAGAFISDFVRMGGWLLGPTILVVVYAALAGIRRKGERDAGTATILTTLLLVLGSYFLIYLITPIGLRFHLDTSADRLLLHLWPGALFWCFLAIRAPEERPGLLPRIAAYVLVLVCVVTGGRALWQLWSGGLGVRAGAQMATLERRLSGVASVLPLHGVIGYTSDKPEHTTEYVWAAYFLAPRIVVDSPNPEIVVLDRHVVPDPDKNQDGSYSLQEQGGMKLYDFGNGIYVEDRTGMNTAGGR
jgi:hypothetical protein